jgi:uncharacterized membrane protein YhhN
MNKNQILLSVFVLVLLIHCFSIQAEMNFLRTATKTILVPLLMMHLMVNFSHKTLGYLPMIALFFSWMGDLLLLGKGSAFFLSGMFAFIVTHFFYSYSFLKIQPVVKKSRPYLLIYGLVLLAASTAVFLYLQAYLGTYRLPVLLYMLFINCMAALAIHTYTNRALSNVALYHFIPGAVLFVLSDALLAVNMFRHRLPVLEVVVMLTYGLAQFFIVKGFQKTAALSE